MSNSIQSTHLPAQKATVSAVPFALPLLTEGNSGSFVKLLQRFLVVYGYFKTQIQQGLEPVDGGFGNQTTAEVMKFQADHFLSKSKDGNVGGLTWCAIAFPAADPNVRGALSPIANASTPLPLLQLGDRVAAVFVLQRLLLLYTADYIPDNPMTEAGVDGIFGANTKEAVTIFQTNYKYAKLTADGQVGNYTWGALFYPSGQRNANQVAA